MLFDHTSYSPHYIAKDSKEPLKLGANHQPTPAITPVIFPRQLAGGRREAGAWGPVEKVKCWSSEPSVHGAGRVLWPSNATLKSSEGIPGGGRL